MGLKWDGIGEAKKYFQRWKYFSPSDITFSRTKKTLAPSENETQRTWQPRRYYVERKEKGMKNRPERKTQKNHQMEEQETKTQKKRISSKEQDGREENCKNRE